MKDGILISATQGEQIKVERVYAGVVIDRYMTANIRKQPACKRAWVAKLATLLDQDHVNIQIEIPPVPAQQANVFDIIKAQANLINTLLRDDREFDVPVIPLIECKLPPEGWYCTRSAGHDGPCAARQVYTGTVVDDLTSAVERAEQNASAERL